MAVDNGFVGTEAEWLASLVGPTGPQGPTQIFGIQAELFNSAGGGIDNNEAIIFDNILNQIGSAISYDATSGEFIISQSGYYRVDWWVTVDGADATTGTVFALNVNGAVYSRASAPPVTSQVTGTAIVTVDAPPITLSITNAGGDHVTFEDTSQQANIVITTLSV